MSGPADLRIMAVTAIAATVTASAAGAMPVDAATTSVLAGLDTSSLGAFAAVSILMAALWVFRIVRGIQTTSRSLAKARGLLRPGGSFEARMAAKMRELQSQTPLAPVQPAEPAPISAIPLTTESNTAAPVVRTFGRKIN